jgi:hypothetical protein
VSEITESIDANDDPMSGFVTGGLVYLVCHLVRDDGIDAIPASGQKL